MSERRLSRALVTGLVPGDQSHRALLEAIVEATRAVFEAAAASILLYDPQRNDLLFAAVAGEGAGDLLGRRIPATSGIAGSVLQVRQPMILDDVRSDPRFSAETAESTGYLPQAIMAAPLALEEQPLGVLEVLDRKKGSRPPLEELSLLASFADLAAAGLDVFQRARRAQTEPAEPRTQSAEIARVAAGLDALGGGQRLAGERLIAALADLLAEAGR